jgi:zinc transport system permease protein
MSILEPDFMRLAFAAGAVVGVLAPAVGFFLVQRQMSLIGDGIGHVAFAGVALGYLLGISPVATALVTSVAGAVTIEWLRARRRATGDQALALLFYTGIAAGVVLVSAAGALDANLFAFLFGSILTVTGADLALVTGLGAGGLGLIALLYRAFVAVAIDEDAARVAGVPVGLLNVLLAALAGVTIAVSMRIVGILLIAALMVLPVVAAGRIAWSVRSTILLSMAIGLVAVFVGLTISYYADIAPGGTIVLVAAGSFVAASGAGALMRVGMPFRRLELAVGHARGEQSGERGRDRHGRDQPD